MCEYALNKNMVKPSGPRDFSGSSPHMASMISSSYISLTREDLDALGVEGGMSSNIASIAAGSPSPT